MIKYDLVYIDDMGDKCDFTVDAYSIKEAMNSLLYFCQDARRIVSCTPQPMFTDE